MSTTRESGRGTARASSSADERTPARTSPFSLSGWLRLLRDAFYPPAPPKKKRSRGIRMGRLQHAVWPLIVERGKTVEEMAAATQIHASDLRQQMKRDLASGFVVRNGEAWILTARAVHMLEEHARRRPQPAAAPKAEEYVLGQPAAPIFSIGDGPGQVDFAGASNVTIEPIEPIIFPRRQSS